MNGKVIAYTLAGALVFCVAVAYMVDARWIGGPSSAPIDSWTGTIWHSSMQGTDFFLDTALRVAIVMVLALLFVWVVTAILRKEKANREDGFRAGSKVLGSKG